MMNKDNLFIIALIGAFIICCIGISFPIFWLFGFIWYFSFGGLWLELSLKNLVNG